MPRPSLGELWMRAGGNRERYRELMLEHGHLVPGEPQPLPCGWPQREAAPPEGAGTGWRCEACGAPGRLGQQCERCGAQVYRSEPTTGGQEC